MQLKYILFILVLTFASVVDIKKRIVPGYIHISLFIVGLIDFNIFNIISGILLFLIVFIIAYLIGGIGGGDIKIIGMSGYILSFYSIYGVIIGLVLAILSVNIYKKIGINKTDKPIPLVPFLTIGYIIYIIQYNNYML